MHWLDCLILGYLGMVFVVTREITRRIVSSCRFEVEVAQAAFTDRQQKRTVLFTERKQFEQVAAETFTLYDITQEIAKHLTEEAALQILRNKLRENFYYEECALIAPLAIEAKELKTTAGWNLFPLRAKSSHLGFLAVKGVPEKDKEKLAILANQFALALQRIRLYEEVERLAMTDSLTEVYTRRCILQRLEEEKKRAEARKTAISFLMIDVDHFKNINDRHGHLAGDQVLREIAKIIRENIREIDICGRYGGEEFCVVLPDTGVEGAYYVAERIRAAVEKAVIQAYDAKVNVTVSIGTATFPQDGKNLTDLLDKSDWAMYKAKKNGRNRVYSSFTPPKTI